MLQPRYQVIKNHLLEQIEAGVLVPGTRVSSENQLSEQFQVSRMTARRALKELSDAGFLFRCQGLGTFIADSRPMSSMLEIRNIADEISDRGHLCTQKVLSQESVVANHQQASWLGVKDKSEIFHSCIIYFEESVAIQYEDRYVNPRLAPDYLSQDFTEATPNQYLSQVAPLTEADNIVEAVTADSLVDKQVLLQMNMSASSPCLKVSRRTYSDKGIVSVASLIHPGDRYRLGGHIHIK
ncbi:MAG: GntR family histidine utilization transcriptional repressor [Arenicella sp.]